MSVDRGTRRTCACSAAASTPVTCRGTDSAIGKRTTATILTPAWTKPRDQGGDGRYRPDRSDPAATGSPSTPSPPVLLGEMEAAVVNAFEGEDPDVIVVEGQGALSHPATDLTLHPPREPARRRHPPARPEGRTRLGDSVTLPMPTPASEIHLIETFAATKVIDDHENMTDAEVTAAVAVRGGLRHPGHRRPEPADRGVG